MLTKSEKKKKKKLIHLFKYLIELQKREFKLRKLKKKLISTYLQSWLEIKYET